jgi:hypothetical protein
MPLPSTRSWKVKNKHLQCTSKIFKINCGTNFFTACWHQQIILKADAAQLKADNSLLQRTQIWTLSNTAGCTCWSTEGRRVQSIPAASPANHQNASSLHGLAHIPLAATREQAQLKLAQRATRKRSQHIGQRGEDKAKLIKAPGGHKGGHQHQSNNSIDTRFIGSKVLPWPSQASLGIPG